MDDALLSSYAKFKFVAIFQSQYASSTSSFHQDTDFSSHYSSRRLFDLPPSSTLGAVGHMSSSSTSSLAGNNAGTNLIVNYLPQDMTDRELYSLFRNSGPIESCRIMRDFKVKQHAIEDANRLNGLQTHCSHPMRQSTKAKMELYFYY